MDSHRTKPDLTMKFFFEVIFDLRGLVSNLGSVKLRFGTVRAAGYSQQRQSSDHQAEQLRAMPLPRSGGGGGGGRAGAAVGSDFSCRSGL